MRRLVLTSLIALSISSSAQTTWMRNVELLCAYYHSSRDPYGGPEHHFLLFYGNDSVVHVNMAEWEGVLQFDHGKSPVQLIDAFIDDFHCEPERFNINTGVTVSWFAGSSMVWQDRYYDQARFEQDSTQFLYGGHRYLRIKCWNQVVPPRWSIRGFSRWCTDEPEVPEEEE